VKLHWERKWENQGEGKRKKKNKMKKSNLLRAGEKEKKIFISGVQGGGGGGKSKYENEKPELSYRKA